MQARNTRKAQTDNYMEARAAIEKRGKEYNFMWLEAVEGKRPDTDGNIDYVIHASNEEAMVPHFAIETYEKGVLQDYQANKKVVDSFAIIPEADRLRVIQAQMASKAIAASQIKPSKVAAPA